MFPGMFASSTFNNYQIFSKVKSLTALIYISVFFFSVVIDL